MVSHAATDFTNCSVSQLILMSVLNCLYESVSMILRKNVEKRALLDNMDVVMLAMDEICDSGYVALLSKPSN